jgi:hypothetical protein
MAKLSPSGEVEPPLYVRWTPVTCPYALEMRLTLITRLKSELRQVSELGVERGGVFVGVFPTPDSPTLRLEDLILVPRIMDSGPEFSLDLLQVRQLAELTAQARNDNRPVVGFFRSHERPVALAPSGSDIAMLSQQFPAGLYAFLLIKPGSPPEGAFFLAMNGLLPESSSTPIFAFEEDSFSNLPEVPAEATEDVRNFGLGQKIARPFPWVAVASLVLLAFLVSLWLFGNRIEEWVRPESNKIGLNVMSNGSNLRITWDHSAPVLAKALGATIEIEDGRSQRQLRLDYDDLRLGQVAYERLTRKVNVVMRVDTPGVKLPPQTFDWTGE